MKTAFLTKDWYTIQSTDELNAVLYVYGPTIRNVYLSDRDVFLLRASEEITFILPKEFATHWDADQDLYDGEAQMTPNGFYHIEGMDWFDEVRAVRIAREI